MEVEKLVRVKDRPQYMDSVPLLLALYCDKSVIIWKKKKIIIENDPNDSHVFNI